MINLSLDSTNKKLEIEVQLKGQTEPLKVAVNKYELVTSESTHFVVLKEVETTYEWLNVVLRTFGLTEKRIELPEQYAELIELAL